jgi:hypothetical protein
VEIVGRMSEAEAFNTRAARAAALSTSKGGTVDTGSTKFDTAAKEEEEGEQRGSKRSKRTRGGAQEVAPENKLMEKYPLHVELVLVPEKVSLQFTYLTTLNVVCAEATHADATLLVNLFPGDPGVASPNTANTLLAPELSFHQAAARPYAWAQQVRPRARRILPFPVALASAKPSDKRARRVKEL